VTALFFGMALPIIGGALMLRRARLGPEQGVRDILSLCCVDPSRVAREVYDAHVALARERAPEARMNSRDFLAAQRSLMVRLMRRRRFYAMVATVRASALIVQGKRDRLVRIEAARALAAARPDWRFEVLDDVGHVPQLEAPERFLAVVEPWLRARAVAA
jgi:pimeloyl-ACP methyl ester carboxylesterase